MIMPIVLWMCYKQLSFNPPSGTIVGQAFKAYVQLFKDGGAKYMFKKGDSFWEHSKPSAIAARGGDTSHITWDDRLVDDLKATFDACKVFCESLLCSMYRCLFYILVLIHVVTG